MGAGDRVREYHADAGRHQRRHRSGWCRGGGGAGQLGGELSQKYGPAPIGATARDEHQRYLILGGQVLVYVGFNAALSRWPSTRVYAWTFLVPAVAVLVEAVRGSLPGVGAMVGIVLVILGVAIVNVPRAEGVPVGNAAEDETPIQPAPRVR
ncbi:MAG TPA: DMT family transporter [Solirubrobacteraceae bacterium]|nr:DMT family transporter [Solirubrobacteraceae bacterium]